MILQAGKFKIKTQPELLSLECLLPDSRMVIFSVTSQGGRDKESCVFFFFLNKGTDPSL